jgi:hypothetical protein
MLLPPAAPALKGTVMRPVAILMLALPMALGGCTAYQFAADQWHQGGLKHGAPGMDADDPIKTATDDMWANVLKDSKQDAWNATDTAKEKAAVEAGMNQVDSMCRNYFGLLRDLDLRRKTLKSEVSQAGTTATAVLTAALTDAAKTIGYVGIGYGALNSFLDINTDQYMYQRSPQDAEDLIFTGLDKARDKTLAGMTSPISEGHAKYLVGRYDAACTPEQIDMQVRAAIKKGASGAVGQPNATFVIQ